MIVTCPTCQSQFRVEDDKVPAEGARLQCAGCATVFMARKPAPAFDEASVKTADTPRPSMQPGTTKPKRSAAAKAPPVVVVEKPAVVDEAALAEERQRREKRGNLMGAIAIVFAALVFALCLLFSVWTVTGSLDGVLMPVVERTFKVRPPRSSTGRDTRTVLEVDNRARKAEEDGDWIEAATHRRRAQGLEANEVRAGKLASAQSNVGASN